MNYGRTKNGPPVKKPNDKMKRPGNDNGTRHGLASVRLPIGWQSDWSKEYRTIRNFYFGTAKKTGQIKFNPLLDMVLKKIAYFSIKLECAMVYMEDRDDTAVHFSEALDHYASSFKRLVDQFLKYTEAVPRPKGKDKPPRVMTDEEINKEIKRMEHNINS